MPKNLSPFLFLFFSIQKVLAQVPVSLTGLVPVIAPNIAVGSTKTFTYTITNKVPN